MAETFGGAELTVKLSSIDRIYPAWTNTKSTKIERLQERSLGNVHFYLISAALTISGLALVFMNWQNRRRDVLSGRYFDRNQHEDGQSI
jgi:hypothetical protein